MCLCKGTGGIKTVGQWSIEFAPCPDSHCQFDRDAARKEYDQWSAKLHESLKDVSAS